MKWNKKTPTEDGYYWLKYKWHHRENVCRVGECQGHSEIELVRIEKGEVYNWGDEINEGCPVNDSYYENAEWIKIPEPKEE
jgi:hypothetical protein